MGIEPTIGAKAEKEQTAYPQPGLLPNVYQLAMHKPLALGVLTPAGVPIPTANTFQFCIILCLGPLLHLRASGKWFKRLRHNSTIQHESVKGKSFWKLFLVGVFTIHRDINVWPYSGQATIAAFNQGLGRTAVASL
jgi:hypothetical protein